MAISYKDAGVDVNEGDRLVDWIQKSPYGKKHHQNAIVSGVGGFASLFRIDFSKYKKPLIVTCTDGVGTKVKIASEFGKFQSVGQDLVAMCVNDLICCGADPLMFLDYYATGKLKAHNAQEFLLGVQKACDESQCALVGGETAEMPGVYDDQDFDCAGFAVGVVDEDQLLGAQKVREGDILLGIESSGFHSNGYSLVRKLFSDDLEKYLEQILTPTHLYVKLMQDLKSKVQLHAAANITGGGIENIPRVIPENFSIELKEWKLPILFQEAQKRSSLSFSEMCRTFNCGVGFVLIISPADLVRTQEIAAQHKLRSFSIGQVVRRVKPEQEIIGV